MTCLEAVLFAMSGKHRARCYVETPGHRIHKAFLPNGKHVEWAGPVGQTRFKETHNE